MWEGIGLTLAGVALGLVGVSMRPGGTPIRYKAEWGFFQDSTRLGKIVGLIGLLVFMCGLRVLLH